MNKLKNVKVSILINPPMKNTKKIKNVKTYFNGYLKSFSGKIPFYLGGMTFLPEY